MLTCCRIIYKKKKSIMSQQTSQDKSAWNPQWTNRRRVIFTSLFFCAGIIIHGFGWQTSESIADIQITMSFMAAMSIVGGYVFGAAWQDINLHKNRQ